MTALIVWVLTENPAREFDKRLGDRRLAEKTVMMGKAEVREVAHGWAEAPPAPRSSGEAVRGLRVMPAYHPYPSRRPPSLEGASCLSSLASERSTRPRRVSPQGLDEQVRTGGLHAAARQQARADGRAAPHRHRPGDHRTVGRGAWRWQGCAPC
jgi:hypothetical protein